MGFGFQSGLNMEPKWSPDPSQKTYAQNEPTLVPKGSQNGAKIIKNEVLEAPCFKGGSQVASRPPPGSILERFGDHFGTIFVSFSNIVFVIFCMHFLVACCKQIRSKSQGIIKRIQQRASKKQLLSSCHLALKSSLANVNELSGPC